MFRRVLVATDFSRYADRILEIISEIPGMEEILLVHITKRPDKQTQQQLDERRHHLELTTEKQVTTKLIENTEENIAEAIVKTANFTDGSLIVVGARGKGFFGELLLGSVSKEIVKRAGIDVLVMRFPWLEGSAKASVKKSKRDIFSHLLCPVDFSRPSEKTIDYVKSLGFIDRVTILHVIDTSVEDIDRAKQFHDCEDQLKRLKVKVESHGIPSASHIRYGDPVTEICCLADEGDVSLIMIARFGRSDYASNIPLGHVVGGVVAKSRRPVFILSPHISLNISVTELRRDQFGLAEEVWLTYHQQKADPNIDRIFGVFVEGVLVATARCRGYLDGFEVDGVYVLNDYRNRGYARKAIQALVDACGKEPLFMHSTLVLVPFYQSFGFELIPESALPYSIKKRFDFAMGNLEGANVSPMRRPRSRSTN